MIFNNFVAPFAPMPTLTRIRYCTHTNTHSEPMLMPNHTHTHTHTHTQKGPIVQWIERRFPKP